MKFSHIIRLLATFDKTKEMENGKWIMGNSKQKTLSIIHFPFSID